ncbi:MAG: hypothetical protein V4686_02980 [Patescibacteria group bacterium]
MSYLSGDKKNILGNRLSNRYLSSDAFTSSAGKMSGRSISRLGSIFKGHKSGRRYSGTGQKVGLFELKNIVLKLVFLCTCIIVVSYTLPMTRYMVHAFFSRTSMVYSDYTNPENADDELLIGEYYVSPLILQTDRFSININETSGTEDGSYVYASPMNTLVGMIEATASNTPRVVLFSQVGLKNNFFFKNSTLGESVIQDQVIDAPIIDENGTTSTSTPVMLAKTQSVPSYTSIVFEGLGYGQMLAKVPPQVTIEVGTMVYSRTLSGLQPVGRVSYVETDSGSTFTNVYAQILTPPYAIYKVNIADPIN